MKKTVLIAVIVAFIGFSQSSHASVFKPVRPEQVPAGMAYRLRMPSTESPQLFAGKRVAILASHGVEEAEITYPYTYLANRGAQVDVLVPEWTSQGIVASRFLKPTLFVQATNTFRAATNEHYDLIVLTGGAWNAQVLRGDGDALNLINQHYRSGKPLAAICAGTAVLINAGLARGLPVAGSPAVRTDLENAGARYIDEPSALAARILTSRTPNDLPAFVTGIRKLLIGR